MTDYSELTDDQINLMAFKAQGWTVGHVSGRGNQFCEHKGGGWVPKVFDYCNDWAAIGPIIEENKISIEYRDHKSLPPQAKRFGSNSHSVADKNPKRAVAICFLMMQGEG